MALQTFGEAHDYLGMPDVSDKKNIENALRLYKKRKFTITEDTKTKTITGAQLIDAVRDQAKRRHADALKNDRGVVDEERDIRIMLSLPQSLVQFLEVGYPTLFKDRRHFEWFMDTFPQLLLPKKRR